MRLCVLCGLVFMSIVENIAAIRERVEAAARRTGRSSDEVGLMGVTKTHPPERIREAYAAGLRVFGENRVQEFAGKAGALADLREAAWHMIGHLQTNKAGKVAELFAAVDSVDSVKLAEKLDAAARSVGKKLAVLIEINVGGEAAKSGVAADSREFEELLQAAPRFEALEFRGLMTVTSVYRGSGGCAAVLPQAARTARCAGRAQASGNRHWMCFPWACHTTSRLRSRKARLACAWGRRFSGNGRRLNHRGRRGTQSFALSL